MGALAPNIGEGRGFLAGFAGQIGFAILVACGDKQQAADTIERMSVGDSPAIIAREIYGCEPTQVGAMLIAACGCGPDAANGIAVSGLKPTEILELSGFRAIWAAGCHTVESLRRGKGKHLNPDIYALLGIEQYLVEDLQRLSIKIARAGHSWQWIE